MKRKITAGKPTQIKMRPPLRRDEDAMADITTYMVDQISSQFKNQALLALNKGTVDKFQDAQVGNFANVFLSLANSVSRKIKKRFSDSRLKKASDKILNSIDRETQKNLYSQVEKEIGIDARELIATEGLKSSINAQKLETQQWLKKIRDETLEEYTNNSLRAMAQGQTIDDVLAQYDDMTEKRKNHAQFTARNQVQNYNSMVQDVRARNLGLERGRWETAEDERVRPSHKDRQGKEFDLSKGCYSPIDGKWLKTGVDYNCRCTTIYVIPEG